MRASELAALVGGTLHGSDRSIQGVAPAHTAGPDQLAFATRGTPGAAGVLLARETAPDRTVVVVDDPRLAFAVALQTLFPSVHPPGVQPGAFVHPSAALGAGVAVYPGAYVGPGCILGDRVVIHPNAVLYPGVIVGPDTVVHAGAVLGADGFAYAAGPQGPVKMPQLGGLRVGARVEVGANTCVDRGALADTVLADDCKLDDLVLVGHNCQLERAVLLAGQVGLAGSTQVGAGVIIGGQAGTTEHTEVGAGARIAAGAGLHKPVPPGATVMGRPARPAGEARRMWALVRRLPDLWSELKALRRRVEALEASV
ncbi:MAG: UDP-3-O-(3-hydroxymyristoyl)glucosamine N-acyltransferase [Myxococcota bacterium]|nr:UDP-3-O-(3-hydroxymyristoyl)glucosamine N-acyltransferase [Myxococcota bacterium]